MALDITYARPSGHDDPEVKSAVSGSCRHRLFRDALSMPTPMFHFPRLESTVSYELYNLLRNTRWFKTDGQNIAEFLYYDPDS